MALNSVVHTYNECLYVTEPDEVPIFVDELHEEVLAIVEEVMSNVKFEDADLPVTDIAIDTLREAIAAAEDAKLERQSSAPRSVVIILLSVILLSSYITWHSVLQISCRLYAGNTCTRVCLTCDP